MRPQVSCPTASWGQWVPCWTAQPLRCLRVGRPGSEAFRVWMAQAQAIPGLSCPHSCGDAVKTLSRFPPLLVHGPGKNTHILWGLHRLQEPGALFAPETLQLLPVPVTRSGERSRSSSGVPDSLCDPGSHPSSRSLQRREQPATLSSSQARVLVEGQAPCGRAHVLRVCSSFDDLMQPSRRPSVKTGAVPTATQSLLPLLVLSHPPPRETGTPSPLDVTQMKTVYKGTWESLR